MNNRALTSFSFFKVVLLTTCLFFGISFFSTAKAETSPPGNPIQLAYYWHGGWGGLGWHGGWGWRDRWGWGFRGPGYPRAVFSPGNRCQKSCLINRWNNRVIRCNTRCFY